MPIVPDVKNWTWVLDETCPECGFAAADTAFDAVPPLAREYAGRLAATLTRPEAALRLTDSVWSPLEYAAHVRDVCRIFAYRTAIAARTVASDPRVPAFDARGVSAAEAADGVPVPPADRGRHVRRSDGSAFTVESLARYFVHDVIHHVHDVRG